MLDCITLVAPDGWRASLALLVTVAAAAGTILLLGPRAYDWVKAVHVVAIIAWMAGPVPPASFEGLQHEFRQAALSSLSKGPGKSLSLLEPNRGFVVALLGEKGYPP